jgi:hypothetical protein
MDPQILLTRRKSINPLSEGDDARNRTLSGILSVM